MLPWVKLAVGSGPPKVWKEEISVVWRQQVGDCGSHRKLIQSLMLFLCVPETLVIPLGCMLHLPFFLYTYYSCVDAPLSMCLLLTPELAKLLSMFHAGFFKCHHLEVRRYKTLFGHTCDDFQMSFFLAFQKWMEQECLPFIFKNWTFV